MIEQSLSLDGLAVSLPNGEVKSLPRTRYGVRVKLKIISLPFFRETHGFPCNYVEYGG